MGQQRKFRVGFYFDMYSAKVEDWATEADYNHSMQPECLELMLEYPPGVENFSDPDVADLKAQFKDVHLTVHAPTLNLSLVALNRGIVKASQDELVSSLAVAHKLNAPLLTIHGGEYPYFAEINQRPPTSEFNRNVKPLLDAAADYGIHVCVENLKNKFIFPQGYADLDSIFEADERLMLAMDVRHFCINKIEPGEAFLRYRSRVQSVQYRIDNGLDDTQLRDFLRLLLKSEFEGIFIIEDAALNVANKTEKPMIAAGLAKIRGMLEELGASELWTEA